MTYEARNRAYSFCSYQNADESKVYDRSADIHLILTLFSTTAMTSQNQDVESPVDEQTPLLSTDGEVQQKHDAVYNRFTNRQKRTILALIALAGLAPRKRYLSSTCVRSFD